MHFPPLEVILSWPTPNYVDPESNGLVTVLWVFLGIFLFLATAAMCTRLFARVFFRNWFGWDDFFIIIAYLCMIGVTAILIIGYTTLHWDRHVWDVPMADITPSAKLVYAYQILWPIGSCISRMSIVCFYYRIMDHIRIKKYRYVLWGVTFWVSGLLTAFVFTSAFSCSPVSAYWAYPPPEGAVCIDNNKAFTALSAVNSVCEVIVALLPIPVVFRLKMDPRQRWGVIVLLGLGVLVATVGSVRTYYAWQALTSYDYSWYATPYSICAVVELSLSIMCACAPALRPVFRSSRFSAKGSRSSRQPSEINEEKGIDRAASTRSILTQRPSDSSTSQITKPDRADSSQSRAILRTDSAASRRTAKGQGGPYDSATSIPRRSTTTPTSQRGQISARQLPKYERQQGTSGSSLSSIESQEDMVAKKSLEIQISYHDNGSDVRSLHVQRSRRNLRGLRSESAPSLDSQASSDGWFEEKVRSESQQRSRSRVRISESESSEEDVDRTELQKPLPGNLARTHLQVPVRQTGEQDSVSLSDFEFEPGTDAASNQTPVSPMLSGDPSPPIHIDHASPRGQAGQTPFFVRRSLSTIASSNLLQPQAAVAAAVAAAAANAEDTRSSIPPSIVTYDSRTRSGVFGSGTADIRTATEQTFVQQSRIPTRIEINNRQVPGRPRTADDHAWWDRYGSTAHPAAPQDGTMWSYAFDRVFARTKNGDATDTLESTTESSHNGLGSGRYEQDRGRLDALDLERGYQQRQSGLTGASVMSSPSRGSGDARDSLGRSYNGLGTSWFDDNASP